MCLKCPSPARTHAVNVHVTFQQHILIAADPERLTRCWCVIHFNSSTYDL